MAGRPARLADPGLKTLFLSIGSGTGRGRTRAGHVASPRWLHDHGGFSLDVGFSANRAENPTSTENPPSQLSPGPQFPHEPQLIFPGAACGTSCRR